MTRRSATLSLAIVTALALSAGGCGSTYKLAQDFLEPFQIYVKSVRPGAPARLSAATGINSRFIAAAGDVDFKIEVYAPTSETTPVIEQEFRFTDGYMVLEIVITTNRDKDEFIQLVPATWEAARASLKHLPQKVTGTNRTDLLRRAAPPRLLRPHQ